MNLTLDGFYAGPNCELDWHFAYWSGDMSDALCRHLTQADTIMLGRVTYSAFALHFPSIIANPDCRGEDFAFASMMNNYHMIVFSKSRNLVRWNHVTQIGGDLHTEVLRLKKEKGKNIIAYGSGRLVQGLRAWNLVDEIHLWLHPVELGQGKTFFGGPKNRHGLKTVSTETFSSGVVMMQLQENRSTSEF